MTTSITASVHVEAAELHRRVLDTGSGVITFGEQDGWPRIDAFFRATPEIDALIAELVALKQEMDPPVTGCDCMADAPDDDDESGEDATVAVAESSGAEHAAVSA